ncbi:MAG: TlpA disulfide reductase family protein [Bacteroidales bacterium]|nr:TlpA disulfide reductase family protein [Bacteroidales bacterium]
MKKLVFFTITFLLFVDLLGAQNNINYSAPLPDSICFVGADSSKVNISEFRDKITVLYFWTSWNGESRKQLQYISTVARKISFQSILFVAVSLDVNRDVWLGYINRFNGGLLQLYAGKDRDIIRDFNIVSVPTVIILNKDKYMVPMDNLSNLQEKLEELLSVNT